MQKDVLKKVLGYIDAADVSEEQKRDWVALVHLFDCGQLDEADEPLIFDFPLEAALLLLDEDTISKDSELKMIKHPRGLQLLEACNFGLGVSDATVMAMLDLPNAEEFLNVYVGKMYRPLSAKAFIEVLQRPWGEALLSSSSYCRRWIVEGEALRLAKEKELI